MTGQMLAAAPLPLLGDAEGARVPEGLKVVDAHVHLFPDPVFKALWRWFEQHAWKVRYRLYAEPCIEFLLSRGVSQLTALVYSHKPGMAAVLNTFVAELAAAHSQIIPLGTVLPGESDAPEIARHALTTLGLRGLKLHCHVQRMGADDPRLHPVYAVAQEVGRPVVIHAGREPSSPAYGLDVRALCGVEQVERVLQRFPRLTLVVPHLGADEFAGYEALLHQYENLWLDTTMVVAGFFPNGPSDELVRRNARRLMYGTDFPNIPFAWDRELTRLKAMGLPREDEVALFSGNAQRLFAA